MSTATLSDQHPPTQADLCERWEQVLRDPKLRDLPFKIETNRIGQIVMTPHQPIHFFYQDTLVGLLRSHLPEGQTAPEFAIFTDEGTKVPDVVWMSMEGALPASEDGSRGERCPGNLCRSAVGPQYAAGDRAQGRPLLRKGRPRSLDLRRWAHAILYVYPGGPTRQFIHGSQISS